ncbi:hypothetical protein, partial [Sinobacterium norvegicum]|uniref:hypothetical protein n=1 Tax=Sinobacterium norvegicum TaxID=1641715 RepID=UPI001F46BF60
VVKRFLADGSVGFPHVRVGHRQAFILRPRKLTLTGFFYGWGLGCDNNEYSAKNAAGKTIKWSGAEGEFGAVKREAPMLWRKA